MITCEDMGEERSSHTGPEGDLKAEDALNDRFQGFKETVSLFGLFRLLYS